MKILGYGVKPPKNKDVLPKVIVGQLLRCGSTFDAYPEDITIVFLFT